ncbi:nuclear transport factor 2 family protein [Amycolatopsis sp. lyj-108]|uniref:nuclear transport factor 2 family protein n=1 Tax=Amycolatopsis sp. lyj-108 TaxID=2789286 RepID=UPI00397B24E3
MTTAKKIVVDCFENLFVRKDFAAAGANVHPDFVTHSPGFPSGRDAFVEAMRNSPITGADVSVKRVIADEDHVVVHLHVVPPGEELGRPSSTSCVWRTGSSWSTGTSSSRFRPLPKCSRA